MIFVSGAIIPRIGNAHVLLVGGRASFIERLLLERPTGSNGSDSVEKHWPKGLSTGGELSRAPSKLTYPLIRVVTPVFVVDS